THTRLLDLPPQGAAIGYCPPGARLVSGLVKRGQLRGRQAGGDRPAKRGGVNRMAMAHARLLPFAAPLFQDININNMPLGEHAEVHRLTEASGNTRHLGAGSMAQVAVQRVVSGEGPEPFAGAVAVTRMVVLD